MTHFRLLDADFLINLIRTLSLVKSYEDTVDNKIEQLCTHCQFTLVSTTTVMNEVNEKIALKNPTFHDRFFESKKQESLKIKKEIFQNIRFIDVRKNPLIKILQSTRPRDPGELSLVVLLSSKYSKYLTSSPYESVKIVSNNSKDILPLLRVMKEYDNGMSKMTEANVTISNYDFYYDLFNQLQFEKPFKNYYYFVSNIDARVYDKNKMNTLIHHH
jgi:hypothetical protein